MMVLARVAAPARKAPFTVEITGRQWWWEVHYVSGNAARDFTTANEIHIPTGVPVMFRLIGADVIHSFWIPQLSGTTDAIPGQINRVWLEARKAGTYYGQCTEYCGVQHANMKMLLVAQTPAEFRAWWDRQLKVRRERSHFLSVWGLLFSGGFLGAIIFATIGDMTVPVCR